MKSITRKQLLRERIRLVLCADSVFVVVVVVVVLK